MKNADDVRIDHKRQLLRERLEQRRRQEQGQALRGYEISTVPRHPGAAYPLSFAQQRLWVIDQMAGASPQYNVPKALRLRGAFDVDTAQRALARVIARHEVLRSTYTIVENEPAQVIAESFYFKLTYHDLRGLPEQSREARVRALIRQDRERPFDLTRDLMVRAAYLQIDAVDAERQGILLFNMHHIAVDGWSISILMNEFATQYKAIAANQLDPLPPLAIQYVDYAAWQQQWLARKFVDEQLSYWTNQLSGVPTLHSLPLDQPRRLESSHTGAAFVSQVPASVSRALRRLAGRYDTTIFVLLHAALGLLLSRHSNSDDIVIGTPTANRRNSLLEPLIGFFLNTLVLRTSTQHEWFADYLAHVKQVNVDAQANQDVPFEYLVEHLRVPRSTQHMPLVQILLNMNTASAAELDLPGLEVTLMDDVTVYAKFDLVLNVSMASEGMMLSWFYDQALFVPDRIERMNGHLLRLLTAIIDAPGAAIRHLPMLSQEEEHCLLYEFNPVQESQRDAQLIQRRFEIQADRCPDAVALVDDVGTMSYRALNEAANRLAHYLQAQGVQAGTLVGLCMGRSIDMVVAVLAVLKAGAAYVPLDPSYPEDRLQHMLRDSALDHLLIDAAFPGIHALLSSVNVVDLGSQEHRSRMLAYSSNNLGDTGDQDMGQLAYVIYTSGSTGRPKGVLQTHENVLRLFDATQDYYRFDAADTWTLFHSLSFDFSVWELWGALFLGGKLVIPSRACTRDPRQFVELCRRHRVSILCQTPSAFNGFSEACLQDDIELPALRHVIFGGEALRISSLEPWWDRYGEERPRLVNMYGITETTVHTTLRPVGRNDAGQAVIGRPLPDQAIYLLDAARNPVPLGAVGEVYVGGAGLARGYLNQPLLTSERFIPNPFATRQMLSRGMTRLYRSGDLARFSAAQELIYVGRNDEQVKVRGFRIELREIEHQLSQLSGVQTGVVQLKVDGSGNNILVAYLVPKSQDAVGDRKRWSASLREELAKRLPDYMVPAFFVPLDKLPLTNNGKLDHRNLPAVLDVDIRRGSYAAPTDELQRYLCSVWAQVLGLHQVSVDDSFFELGGNSLSAIRVINQVQQRIGAIVHLVATFEAPTVAQFAAYLALHYRGALHECGLLSADGQGEPAGTQPKRVAISADAAKELRRLVPVVPRRAAAAGRRNRRAVFVLSPPRSGSTLLRTMLGGHPGLFAPPELELLAFDTLSERREAFSGRNKFWTEGTVRALMACRHIAVEEAEALMKTFEAQGMSVQSLYEEMQVCIGDAILVDKTPSYAYASEILERAEASFEDAQFIHLVRHPYGMIRSFEQAHLDRLLYLREHELSARQLAELLWAGCHQNILAVLEHIPARRQHRIIFEELVSAPEAEMRRLCAFLSLPYDPAMLDLYDTGKDRMTDGLHGVSRMLGDVKFHQHKNIDSGTGDAWKNSVKEDFLSETSWRLASAFGYERNRAHPASQPGAIERASNRENIPLSFSQQRLWFIDRLGGTGAAYHIAGAVRLQGQLDPRAFRAALDSVVERHEALNTVFSDASGSVVQVIRPPAHFALWEVDLSALTEEERTTQVSQHAMDEAHERFDLSAGPLVRGRLLRKSVDEHVLLVTMHHIISDGWSMGVLIDELGSLYEAYRLGRPNPLEALTIQYADYAQWQRQWLQGQVLQSQLDYWRQQLSDAPALLELPTDRLRPLVQSFRGGSVGVRIDAQLRHQLNALARTHDATLYMVLLAGLAILLSRLSGQEDVVIGAPIANRQRAELERLIGLFVNTLALRVQLHDAPSVTEVLARVKALSLDAYSHQEAPFEQVVEAVNPQRSMSHTPVFQVMLALQNMPRSQLQLPGLILEHQEVKTGSAQFDLTVILQETDGSLVGAFHYASDLFDATTIERWVAHYLAVLRAMTLDARRSVGSLSFLTQSERRQLLKEFNATQADYPSESCVHELFEMQVARSPDAVAVVYEDQQLSYAELNSHANRLAHHLISLGVRPDDRVAICAERSLEMVIGMLAVLKAGGAYVPLDPAYPPERLAFMLADSEPTVVLTSDVQTSVGEALRAALITCSEDVPLVDLRVYAAKWSTGSTESPDPRSAGSGSRHLAYVIYTSGSTGQPKGVMVEHRNVLRLIVNSGYAPITAQDCVAHCANPVFDASTWEVWSALLNGARLLIVPPAVVLDAPQLNRTLIAGGASALWLTAGLFNEYVDELTEAFAALKFFLIGGDVLDPRTVGRLLSRSRRPQHVINGYGPTESTTFATTYEIMEAQASGIPIGRPIANTQVYVLDDRCEPVPLGVKGELYIGGAGVARGYLNRVELTAQRFIKDPFTPEPEARLYRTGDLGRHLPDGTIEFLGRSDQQIKIRGYRIELGEIEAQLGAYPGVNNAVAIAREEASGNKRLVAYYTVDSAEGERVQREPAVSAEALRTHLLKRLPEYMVPAAYVRLAALPLTPNGKLDRRLLPAPADDAYAMRGYEAPQGPTEQVVAQIWSQLLGVQRVGRHDNFFELGGHSLLAVSVMEQMRRVGLNADVRALYMTPTLAALAAAVSEGAMATVVEVPENQIPMHCAAITPQMLPLVELTAEEIERIVAAVPGGAANVQDIYPLAPLQEGILFHHLMSASKLDPYVQRAILSFDSRARLDSFVAALQAVIDRHDILRTAVMWEGLSRPVQVVVRRAHITAEEVSLPDAQLEVAEQLRARRYQFDLREAPLLRVFIAEDAAHGRWMLQWVQHHLIDDHVSLRGLTTEVQLHLLGRQAQLPAALPFRNFVAQAQLGVSQQEHEAFFTGLLGDVEEPTAPFGLVDALGDGSEVTTALRHVDATLAARLRARARTLGVGAASLFHLAFAHVLARASGREDVVFGTVLFGRMQGGAGADRVPGLFINTLPVRIRVGEPGAQQSAREVHRVLAQLLRHEHASLGLAQRCSGVAAPTPLFSALLNYRHHQSATEASSAEAVQAWEGVEFLGSEGHTNYPLTLSVDDVDGGFRLHAHVQASLDPERICSYIHIALEQLVEALERAPTTSMRNLEILPTSERHRLLVEWNATQAEYPSDSCLHELFEMQAGRTADAVAVIYEDQQLSYRELNAQANRLAHHLIASGVGPDDCVVICAERSLEMVVGLLAVLKAGGAYVPLDPAYPLDRLAFMLADSEPVMVLTSDLQTSVREVLLAHSQNIPLLDLGVDAAKWSTCSTENPDPRSAGLCSKHLAYVIYTSGSTGRPKGVMVEHRSVVNLAITLARLTTDSPEGSWGWVASYAFDASVKGITQLMLGRSLLVISDRHKQDTAAIRKLLQQHRVAILDCTPSMVELWFSAALDDVLPDLIVGGEPIAAALWRRLVEWQHHQGRRTINVYGPTECCVDSTSCVVEGEHPHIGRTLANVRTYVLDSQLQLALTGCTGELYIGGAGVARGYLNQPGLTAERFIADSCGESALDRLYKTGDLVRLSPEGNLEFIGRNDGQVKLRGYRIELGEIETHLRELPAVLAAAVLAKANPLGEKRLVAYVVIAPEQRQERADSEWSTELRNLLSAKLPQYMMPAAFALLERLPLTSNGKTDRRALQMQQVPGDDSEYLAPSTPVEIELARIWADLLRRDVQQISARADFFASGGHSLLVVRLVAQLRSQMAVELSIREVFDSPQLSALAQRIENSQVASRLESARRNAAVTARGWL